MKTKLTTAFILLLITAAPTLGQTTEQLSPAQRQLYKQNSFRVELPGVRVVSDSGEDLSLGYSRHWTVYRGYNNVSEADFFALAGHRDLAQQAKRSRQKKFVVIGLGSLSVIAGSVLVASGNGFKEEGGLHFSMGSKLLGGLMITVGGGAISFAGLGMRHRRAPYWIAEEVAQTYNAQLLEEMYEQP